jgi:hypothetical protein
LKSEDIVRPLVNGVEELRIRLRVRQRSEGPVGDARKPAQLPCDHLGLIEVGFALIDDFLA